MASKSGVKIVKSSGDLAVFDPNVITTECVEAGIEFWTAADAALAVSKGIYDGISTKDIQERLEKVLLETSPEAAERYRRFHSMLVRTSRNTIESFDRKRIASSLMKETKLPKELAENVAKESEEELRRVKLDFISAPLIREVVNVKLLEHGFEDARADYTRLGIPVFDASQLVEAGAAGEGKSPQVMHKLMADNVLREYTLLKVLPLHQADAHMRGEIHIHALECFVTKPYSFCHNLRYFFQTGLVSDSLEERVTTGPAKRPEVAILHVAQLLQDAQSHFSGPQRIEHFNYFLAPYLEGLKPEEVMQLAQSFVYEMSQRRVMSEICIDYFCPDSIGDLKAVKAGGTVKGKYRDYKDEARAFADALTQVYLKGDHKGRAFLYPKAIYSIKKEGKDDKAFMSLVHKLALKYGTPTFAVLDGEEPNQGTLQAVTLNMPRIAYESGEEGKFYEILDDRLAMAREVIMVKRDVIKRRLEQGMLPFLSQTIGDAPYYSLDEVLHTIAFLGINEAAKAQVGAELHESNDAWRFGLQVMRHIYKVLQEWTEETQLKWALTESNEDTARRLAKLDYGQFSDRSLIGDPENPSYTGACFLSSEAELSPLRKLQVEGAFHPYCRVIAQAEVTAKSASTLFDFSKKILEDTEVKRWRYLAREVKA
ncbi:MAG: anaerobic ribonucleoside-triphosphate reductase [Candidatus Hydrothermarchaeales archaeon]